MKEKLFMILTKNNNISMNRKESTIYFFFDMQIDWKVEGESIVMSKVGFDLLLHEKKS